MKKLLFAVFLLLLGYRRDLKPKRLTTKEKQSGS